MDEAWIASRLDAGIPRSELELHVQPIVDILTGRDTGGESFIRWIHPDRGFVPPLAWIPHATRTDVLGQVATSMVGDWLAAARHEGVVSLNVDPAQLRHDGFHRAIADIPADRCDGLAIEIHHEHLAEVAGDPNLTARVHEVCDRGIQLWVDDLDRPMPHMIGAALPAPEAVKLDRSTLEFGDQQLVDLVQSARPAAVTMEGIETTDQLDRCRSLGIENGQGFLWGLPLRLADWLARAETR